MLFNSYGFLLLFFPTVFVGFFLFARHSPLAAAGWLAAASLFFYGWWKIEVLPLLVLSIVANYLFGRHLTPGHRFGDTGRKRLLWLALGANLSLLGYFKYADFFIANTNVALGAFGAPPLPALNVVLPIGISFYTFTQIAFLVDCWQGKVRERNFVHYALFVTYFPHLIAGPVLHHAQMMPQFAQPATYRIDFDKVAIGVVIFSIGLAKKLLIADPAGVYADALFDPVSKGLEPMLFMSWLGVLAYAVQIYFDFSGYSDMAIGLSSCFGIRLPVNFDAPYKAASIVDFWRRWHISLSTFLRDYLYIPLGGNRYGVPRRYLNLMTTMLLGGLWHGASWTFVLWGAAHGTFLVINHGWQRLVGENRRYGPLGRLGCRLITFAAVCFAWVLFRADSLASAARIYRGLAGFNGVSLTPELAARLGDSPWISASGIWQNVTFAATPLHYTLTIALGLAIAFACPSSTDIHQRLEQRRERGPLRLSRPALAAVTAMFATCLLMMSSHTQFLYFQF